MTPAPPALIAEVLADYARGVAPDKQRERDAVKMALAALTARAPGRSVEVRIPPFAAVQAVEGTTHRRGTPSAVVETDARTWLELAAGARTWHAALAEGLVHASGERSDLSGWLPLYSREP